MPSQYEQNYCKLIKEVLRDGNDRNTRNHPTRAVFGKTLTVSELCWGQFPKADVCILQASLVS